MKRLLLFCAVLASAVAGAQERVVQPLGNISNSVEVRGAFRLNDTVANAPTGSIAYKTGVVYVRTPSAWTPLGGGGASFSGTILQYVRGDGSYATFPTNISAFTNDVAYLNTANAYTKAQINAFFGGTAAIGGYNKTNWDQAFTWGNHAGLYPTITRFLDSLSAHHIRILNAGSGTPGTGDMTKLIYDVDNDGVVDNSELLAGQNAAYYLSRANHTGTQAISTVTGLQTALNEKQALLDDGTGLVRSTAGVITYDNTAYVPPTRTINTIPLSSNITLTTANITESGNLYHTTNRVQAVIDANPFYLANVNATGSNIFKFIGDNMARARRIRFSGGGVDTTASNDSILSVVINTGSGGPGGDVYKANDQTFTGANTFVAPLNLGTVGDGRIKVSSNEMLRIDNGGVTEARIGSAGIHVYLQNVDNSGNIYATGPAGVTSNGRFVMQMAGLDITGNLTIGAVANDNTLDRLAVIDPITGETKYRTVASLPSSSSSGTVSSGSQYRIGVYNTAGTTISQANAITSDRALISDANGLPTHSLTTATQLGYLNTVTSNVQTQLNGKAATSHVHSATDITTGTLPIARGGTGISTIGTVGQSYRVAAGGTALEWYTPGTSVSDGNKGDVTVTDGGVTWTVNNGAITNAKIAGVDASKITGLAAGGGVLYELNGSIASSPNYKYDPLTGRATVIGSFNDYNGFSVKNTSSGIYAFADYLAENNVGTLGSVGVGSSNYTYLSGRNRTGIGGTTGVSIISNTDTTSGGPDDIRFYPGGVNVNYFGMGSYGLRFPDGTFQTTAGGSGSYSLPTATASVLGGIKIGSGLSIDGAGVVSASGGSGTAPTVTTLTVASSTLTVTGSYDKTYVYDGTTTATWTLPALGTPGQKLSLINTSAFILTVQGVQADDIYSDEELASFPIYPGDAVDLKDIVSYWKITN